MSLLSRIEKLEARKGETPPMTETERQDLMSYISSFLQDVGPQPVISGEQMQANLTALKRELQAIAYPNR